MMRMTAWTAPTNPARAVSCMWLLALPVWLGPGGAAELFCATSHPCAVFPQVGAALYATGAARRRVLTRTGECSAPVGLAGCCRRMDRAVLVRRGQGVHASGTCGFSCQEWGLPRASAPVGTPASNPTPACVPCLALQSLSPVMSQQQLVHFGVGTPVLGSRDPACL